MTASSTALKARGRGKASPKRPSSAGARRANPRAARLDPEVRQEMILQTAAELVTKQGISSCSLEAVAKASGVSKALVYKYFPNRDSMLGALLQREFDHMRGHEKERQERAKATGAKPTIDDVLSEGVHGYLDYLGERGVLFRTLINDAGVAGQVHVQEALRRGQGANMRFWNEHLISAYNLPEDLVRAGVIMTSFALEGAQGSIRSGKISQDRLADFWTTFVRAGWKAAARKYARK
jgi:AcrR family transcriptional regulator